MADSWFQKEEYATLRKEVESNMTELATLEKVCVGGVAAIFAWIAKNSGDYHGFEKFVWMVPSILPIFGMLKAKAIGSHLTLLGQYLREVEIAHLPEGSSPGGWEAYFEKHGLGERTKQTRRRWVAIAVVTLLGSSVGLAEALFRNAT